MRCCFVSDLHGKTDRYEKLFRYIRETLPEIVFIGGDILPHGYIQEAHGHDDFITGYMAQHFKEIKDKLKDKYPDIYIILGNDDPRVNESKLQTIEEESKLWVYAHQRVFHKGELSITGYSFIPPTPFGLKDWEKYDVSRYVDPGCTHPYQGMRSVEADYDPEYENIKMDIDRLLEKIQPSKTIFLFHSPPYNTVLDRAGLDGQTVDHVPLDVHVGSIAIQRFIQEHQPLITLHGHIHEASSITGKWMEKMGHTYAFNAAYDKSELAIVEFNAQMPDKATRKLL